MYSHYQLIRANNFWQRQGRYVGRWWGEARTPSLLFASGHHSQVPEMFGPYFEIPPSTCARGWPQVQQPGGQVGTSGGSGWLAQATAWWWGSLGYIHGAVPSALFHSKKLRDASSEHWDGAASLFQEEKINNKKIKVTLQTFWREWKIIKNLTLKWLFGFDNLVLGVLVVPHQLYLPWAWNSVDPHLPKATEMKDLGFSTSQRARWPQSWDETSAKLSCKCRSMRVLHHSSGICKLLEQGPFLYSSQLSTI